MKSSNYELPAVGFIDDLGRNDRSFLAGFGKFIRPVPGEVVIQEGDQQEHLYLVLNGKLHVVSQTTQRNTLLAKLKLGDSIGEINIFDPQSASASVVAVEDSLLWKISANELEGFFDADASVGVRFMKGLLKLNSKRIRRMNKKLLESQDLGSLMQVWATDQD